MKVLVQTIIEISKGELRPVFWSHARKSHTQFLHRTHTYDIARVCTHVRNSFFEKIFLSLIHCPSSILMFIKVRFELTKNGNVKNDNADEIRIFPREIRILYIGARSCSASLDTISPVSNPSNIKTMLR